MIGTGKNHRPGRPKGLEKGTPLSEGFPSFLRKALGGGWRDGTTKSKGSEMTSKRQVSIFRASTSDDRAKGIAHRIKAIDYELIALVTGDGNADRAPLNTRVADLLARIQRDLRALRIDMEVERRFDTMPMSIPRHES